MLEEGATYKCPNEDCGCEVKVTKGSSKEESEGDAPTCCCGTKMVKQ